MLRRVARIEEVYRLLEVLNSIGVRTRWINGGIDPERSRTSASSWRRWAYAWTA
jgi:hypothetical protein